MARFSWICSSVAVCSTPRRFARNWRPRSRTSLHSSATSAIWASASSNGLRDMHEFNLIYTGLTILGIFGLLQGICGFLVYVERKICAYMQDRIGPNRVGPWGLLQVLADG